MTQSDILSINRCQHFIAKQIQGLPIRTRSDMAEPIIGLHKLSAAIEIKKLMFLHKILSLPDDTITYKLFRNKFAWYKSDNKLVQRSFIPDICSLLRKHNLYFIVNECIEHGLTFPLKSIWKRVVKHSVLRHEYNCLEQRLSSDNEFLFFRILHPLFKPAVLYSVSKTSSFRGMQLTIARLWCRPFQLAMNTCDLCEHIYYDHLAHVLCECEVSSSLRHSYFHEIHTALGNDVKHQLESMDSIDMSLKMLGAPIEPILGVRKKNVCLKLSYIVIVKCIRYCL